MSLVIKAIDTMGASAESASSLEVRDGNQAPVVAMPIPDLQVADGTFLQFAVLTWHLRRSRPVRRRQHEREQSA
ncbi:hypothetical protein LP419_11460 [Massilia sp. H-1]|nr:hypothetical protein LP419_11460 [Massilia sp. H-1]